MKVVKTWGRNLKKKMQKKYSDQKGVFTKKKKKKNYTL